MNAAELDHQTGAVGASGLGSALGLSDEHIAELVYRRQRVEPVERHLVSDRVSPGVVRLQPRLATGWLRATLRDFFPHRLHLLIGQGHPEGTLTPPAETLEVYARP